MPGYLYILVSRRNGTLYVGSTVDLSQRMEQHRSKAVDGFTRRYNVLHLVHAEAYGDIREARARERQIKAWRRAWKIALIEADNPQWLDLSERRRL